MSKLRCKSVVCAFTLAAVLLTTATQVGAASPAEDLGHGYSREGNFVFFGLIHYFAAIVGGMMGALVASLIFRSRSRTNTV